MIPDARRCVLTKEAAAYVGLAESTLEKDRISGRLGIPFLKLGRAVRYEIASLDDWLASRRQVPRSST